MVNRRFDHCNVHRILHTMDAGVRSARRSPYPNPHDKPFRIACEAKVEVYNLHIDNNNVLKTFTTYAIV